MVSWETGARRHRMDIRKLTNDDLDSCIGNLEGAKDGRGLLDAEQIALDTFKAEWARRRSVVVTLDEAVAAVKAAVNADMDNGVVPKNVRSFSRLHDYVDANVYLINALPPMPDFEDEDDDNPERIAYWELGNEVASVVDRWLRNWRK
jgi:hypothetical protein